MASVGVSGRFDYQFNAAPSSSTLLSVNGGYANYTNGRENLGVDFSGATVSFIIGEIANGASVNVSGTDISKYAIGSYIATGNYQGLLRLALHGNDYINATPGIDAALEHQPPANLVGGEGNDRFYQTSGNVDGGGGLNTLTVAPGVTSIAQTGDYSFTITGSYQQMGVSGPTQMLIHATDIQRITTLRSTDVTAYDISGDAGQAYRLYQAAFARTPDTAGLSDQVNALDHGLSLHDLAANFLGSAEFQQRYGAALSNTDFVAALYQNALHRAPDAAGQANWVNALNAGAIDRATALAGFSESLENHIAVDPVLATGIHLDAAHLTFG